MARQRVGLFGGSFNPPHLAHLIVAEQVREQTGLDRVLWVPCHTPPTRTNRNWPRRITDWPWCGWPSRAIRFLRFPI